MISIRKRWLLLVWMLCRLTPLVANEGLVLLFYGVPCAGKSTLSQEIANTFPENIEVIKRAPNTLKLRMDHVEEITGTRPKNSRQLKEIEQALPQKYQKNFRSHFKEKAIDPTVEQIRKGYREGKNIIFDICLYHDYQINKLKDLRPIPVLVYCPLSELSRRELERTRKTGKEISEHQKARKEILIGFSALFQPTTDADAIDYLTRQDLLNFRDNTLGSTVDEAFAEVLQEAISQFGLEHAERIGIVPKTKPEILIHSGKIEVKENAQRIHHFILNKKGKVAP